MKKLIIAAAIVCAAALAQAATYSWEMAFAASPDGESPLAGTVYAFDANKYTLSAVSTALASTGSEILGSALGSVAIDGDGIAALSGSGLTDDGNTPAYASMFAVIVGENGGKNYFFGVDVFASQKITDAVIAGGANFNIDYVETGAVGSASWSAVGGGSGGGGSEAVPEPTSGMLLLLGMAGLALRRRRA